ncbi:hypothetical protein FB451DRAFT_1340978 [Mycena latifolia]|nr:hypothetical protein FB451DRAFT_1340978 [Mycena latifolia]
MSQSPLPFNPSLSRAPARNPTLFKVLPSSASTRTEAQLAAIREELKLLPELVKKSYTKWTTGATKCQLECMEAQALGRDTVLHAATGAGKTGIAAGPHLLPSSKGKVTLVVSPLLSLHEEQVETFKSEFGLKAIAINSAHGGCTKEIVQYGSIGIIRAFLPRAVPIIAVSATLTPRVHQDILTKLRIDPKDYLYVNIGNDRPTVSHVVRAMEHPMNSYRDLDFVVPDTMVTPTDIPKTFLYCDDTKDGSEIIDHLNDRVHQDYRSRGLVRPYNASMSREYRDTVMQLFRAGVIRVLVCTDAAGMGSRGRGREGLAVMLVEKTAFEANATGKEDSLEPDSQAAATSTVASSRGRGGAAGGGRGRGGRGRGWGRGRGRGWGRGKDYAVLHGQKRGPFGGKHDKISRQPEPEIPPDAPGEGIYVYIQSTTCRRAVQAAIFQNEAPNVSALKCCDLCNPRLFDRTRPSKPLAASRQQASKKGLPVDSVRQSLYGWRRTIKKEKYPRALFSPLAILDDDACERLSSIGPIQSLEQLAQHLGGWARWDTLGVSLFQFMSGLDIPELVPLTRKRCSKQARTRRSPSYTLSSASDPVLANTATYSP